MRLAVGRVIFAASIFGMGSFFTAFFKLHSTTAWARRVPVHFFFCAYIDQFSASWEPSSFDAHVKDILLLRNKKFADYSGLVV